MPVKPKKAEIVQVRVRHKVRYADFLASLQRLPVELDQRIAGAFKNAPIVHRILGDNTEVDDFHIFIALCLQNSISARDLVKTLGAPESFLAKLELAARQMHLPTTLDESILLAPQMPAVLTNALNQAYGAKNMLTGHFVSAVVDQSVLLSDAWGSRPHTVDAIIEAHGGQRSDRLTSHPDVAAILQDLKNSRFQGEDYQYALALIDGQIGLRMVTVVGDDYHLSSGGVWAPRRTLLTEFRNRFSIFSEDEVFELEILLNESSTTEHDFQVFFEAHPHFLRLHDFREVFPQVVLARPGGDLRPDFILTDRDLQRAAILELKLPSPRIIRRQQNRDRFSAVISEARAQLLEYRDWFRDRYNRAQLVRRVGMELYEPVLMVVIGRSADFTDALDRQRLQSRTPDIEIITYDDILIQAKRRLLFIGQ